jgi:hypothetical protein
LIPFDPQRNSEKLQPARISAIIAYIWATFILCFVIYSDLIKDDLISSNEANNYEMSQDEVEKYVFFAKASSAVSIAFLVAVDFVIRFLVIDSLYRKFREERKTPQLA